MNERNSLIFVQNSKYSRPHFRLIFVRKKSKFFNFAPRKLYFFFEKIRFERMGENVNEFRENSNECRENFRFCSHFRWLK